MTIPDGILRFVKWATISYTESSIQVGQDNQILSGQSVQRDIGSPTLPSYVAANGNDATGTGAIGAPFLTLEKARTSLSSLLKSIVINSEGVFEPCDRILTGNYLGIYATNGFSPTIKAANPIVHDRLTSAPWLGLKIRTAVVYRGRVFGFHAFGAGNIRIEEYDYNTKAAAPTTEADITITNFTTLALKGDIFNGFIFGDGGGEDFLIYDIDGAIDKTQNINAGNSGTWSSYHMDDDDDFYFLTKNGTDYEIWSASDITATNPFSLLLSYGAITGTIKEYQFHNGWHYIIYDNSGYFIKKFKTDGTNIIDEGTDISIDADFNFFMDDGKGKLYIAFGGKTYDVSKGVLTKVSDLQMYSIRKSNQFTYAAPLIKQNLLRVVEIKGDDLDLVEVGAIVKDNLVSRLDSTRIISDGVDFLIVGFRQTTDGHSVIEIQTTYLDVYNSANTDCNGIGFQNVWMELRERTRRPDRRMVSRYCFVNDFQIDTIGRLHNLYNCIINNAFDILEIESKYFYTAFLNTGFTIQNCLFLNCNRFRYIEPNGTSDSFLTDSTFINFGIFDVQNDQTWDFENNILASPLYDDFGIIEVTAASIRDNLYEADILIKKINQDNKMGLAGPGLASGFTITNNENEFAFFRNLFEDMRLRAFEIGDIFFNSKAQTGNRGAYSESYGKTVNSDHSVIEIPNPDRISYNRRNQKEVEQVSISGEYYRMTEQPLLEFNLEWDNLREFTPQNYHDLISLYNSDNWFEVFISGFKNITISGKDIVGENDLNELWVGRLIREIGAAIEVIQSIKLYRFTSSIHLDANFKHVADPFVSELNVARGYVGYVKPEKSNVPVNIIEGNFDVEHFRNFTNVKLRLYVYEDFNFEDRKLVYA